MRLAHLADVHLGFRQYHRLNKQGINQREADVATAFRNAIEQVIEAKPDVVVIAGDLFHSVRPSNPAILDSFNQFRRLRLALPSTPIVVVAGDHDTPRSVETGTILRLFEALELVFVVLDEPKTLRFDQPDVSITCVPSVAWKLGARPSLVPSGPSKYHVAVTHGEVAGVLPTASWSADYGGAVLEPAELHTERWDYVALGHFHVAHKVRDNAWYAGALEYVSPNPWGELKDEAREGREGQKGWLLVELGGPAPVVEFRRIQLARALHDLESIQATGLAAEEIDSAIAANVASIPGGIEDRIIRQVVYDVPRPIARHIDHAFIREAKSRALHFHVDLRRPPLQRAVGLVSTEGERHTLRDVLVDYVERRPLDDSVRRADLVALATRYIDQVERDEADT